MSIAIIRSRQVASPEINRNGISGRTVGSLSAATGIPNRVISQLIRHASMAGKTITVLALAVALEWLGCAECENDVHVGI